ncbi:MAG: ATP-binding cassette domain-containing protein [Lachnospiraceae bacterium]|nr:ATP-binding cassette domain-containing protein [Lachnospiraceae bacterium]
MGLKIENLTKTYGDFTALNSISLEAENGKILGILGRNGAGKTTTIKSIMGIIEPDSGTITFDGKDIRKADVSIGYLPEERGLYVNAVVKDQLLYFAMLNGMDKKKAMDEIKRLLEVFKIPGYLNKKVKTLSKGNKQKIQLISAILHKPQIVILDEPFSGLDPVNIELFKNTVLNLRKEGATILFSSHRMEDVEEMCDRIVMLNKGNVVENNTVKGLIDKYSREDVMNVVTNADITALVVENGLFLEKAEGTSFDIKFNNTAEIQSLYKKILDAGIEICEIRSRKTTLQEIFIKELADNE